MAKKTSKKSEPKQVSEPKTAEQPEVNESEGDIVEFEEICAKYRAAKIQEKKALKEKEKWEKIIKQHAIDNNLKGDLNGLKFIQKFAFLEKENLDTAKEHNIEVPVKKSLVVPEEKLIELIVKAGLDPETFKVSTPDLKALEQIFKEMEIQGMYSLSVSLGLSDVE